MYRCVTVLIEVFQNQRERDIERERERKSEMKKVSGVFKVNSFFSEDALEII